MKVKFRHKVLRFCLEPILKPLMYIKYGYRTKKIKEKDYNLKPPYLILATHYAQLDPLMMELSFPRHLYFVANDDIFNSKIISGLINYIASPIPISKGIPDITTIINIKKIVAQNGCVAVFPEGNTTYTGVTGNISETIGKLIKMLKIPVVFYRFDGLFFVAPRWGRYKNRGPSSGGVIKVLQPSEYEKLQPEQINAIVREKLYYNSYQSQKVHNQNFKGRRKAENLERVLYQCPSCKSYSTLNSRSNDFFCTVCGYKVTINSFGFFESEKIIYDNIHDWYQFQLAELKKIDFSAVSTGEVLCHEEKLNLYWGARRKRKKRIGRQGTMKMFKNRIEYYSEDITLVLLLDNIKHIVPSQKRSVFLYMNDGDIYKLKFNLSGYIVKTINFFYAIKNYNQGGNYDYMGL